MAQRWNIAEIDDYDGKNNPKHDDEDLPNHSDFYDDIEDWYSEDENEKTCDTCAGTGEGRAAGTTCSTCHGSGTIKKKKY